jgi:hypothetical protein
MKILVLIALIACYFSLMGCSTTGMFNSFLVSALSGDADSGSSIFESENYQLLEASLPPFILLVENAAAGSPDDDELLAKATELNVFYAMSFLQEKDPEWASLHYKQAKKHAWKVMKLRYDIREKDIVGQPESNIDYLLRKFDKESAPDLLWLGLSWGLWINLNKDDSSAVAEFTYVRKIMERVLELIPNYQNGLPHLFFGSYYSSSQAMGGSPEKAKEHFDAVLKLTNGEYLTAKVMYATNYACAIQDRALYQHLLEEVINAPESKNKSYRMGNAMAKKQAKIALDKIDEYFLASNPSENIEDTESEDTEPSSYFDDDNEEDIF